MTFRFSVFVFAPFLAVSALAGLSSIAPFGVPPAMAQASATPESAAFEQAKELGTADAWHAFINSFSNGFHADLARAYLKKLGDQPQAANVPAAQTVLPSAQAVALKCTERKAMRSLDAGVATKITFINASGADRLLKWIDYEGKLQDNGLLKAGHQVTIDTYRTHPFLIATPSRDCLQIFLPGDERATVELGADLRPAATTANTNTSAQPTAARVAQAVPTSARAAERKCSERRGLRSKNSNEATKITFINSAGSDRVLKWIDFNGKLQDYGRLNAGHQVTIDTYRTHPWVIETGAGNCMQVFLPAAQHATVELRK
ncbi:hypothetical protein [Hyphomicrobium sp. D-2]|uniref:VHL beta domain-containing protein n=1 Tax=Hyphomicrobium sp. D-2 TaxID=3041621 RepID=UPI0024560FA8|nr:hypothetical protein [Hyphomicrobium sp. D-2]MDH4982663.1 hypothetical protein [Hyphomicrobium sp. D-2]